MSPGRTLPLRVPIVAGEALDSWLEALTRRHQVTVGTLTAALGWPVPANPGGLVSGIPGHVLRRIEDQTGLPAGRLDVAVLDRYLPLGPIRRRGSWYCPSCLAERDGRWLLIWRLGRVFACPAHGVLLCDTCPACGRAPGPFRSAIAACLLLPGHPGRAISTAITALHAYRSALAVGAVLRALADGGHDTVLTAISCLAGYLDTYGSRIDYQRRRDLIPAETITTGQWGDLCYGAAAHPGEARRHRDAQRYLFQLLTGADLHDSRHALAFTSNYDYSRYHAFADALPTGLRDALHHHAAALLPDLGIGEPLTWAPPPSCCAGLDLPGPEPDDIDLDAVSRLIITQELPVAEAAAQLGTTGGHLRLALDRVPRPARQWGRSAAPPTWQRRQHARGILTREFFEREYIAAGKNLRQLEADTGIPSRTSPRSPASTASP